MEDMAVFLGRWHPLLVHLPIGMLIMAFLLEWMARRPKFAAFGPAVQPVLLVGGIAAVLSCIAGYFLSLSGGYNENTLFLHKWLGIAVAIVALGIWLLKRFSEKLPRFRKFHFPLFFLMVLILSVAGHFGGSLTHGSDYLSQALPKSIKGLLGISIAQAAEMPVIANVQEAAVFNDVIGPILAQRCLSCHNSDKMKGELRLDSREMLLKGGENGKILLAGDPDESELYKRLLLPEDHDDHMPPKGKTQLSAEQIKLIHWWIASGAPFEKKVKEIQQSDTIKPLLLALESVEGENQHAYLPQEPVKAATKDGMQALIDRGVKVMPVGQGSNFLQVNCINDTLFGDEQVPLLLSLKEQIVWLKLSNTQVSDAGLSLIAGLPNLTRLHLAHTSIGDEGLKALTSSKSLAFLDLYDTRISDVGLQQLQRMKSLKELYLYKTGVSSQGVAELSEKRPELKVDTGNYQLPVLAADTIDY